MHLRKIHVYILALENTYKGKYLFKIKTKLGFLKNKISRIQSKCGFLKDRIQMFPKKK